jgi:Domain of unknown function (DUF4062)
MSSSSPSDPLRIMVASSVYGFEDDLIQICGALDVYGYLVRNSHLGTIRTHPGKSNLENCLEAVRECDLFLGIIRPFYGTGVIGERSITHEEMRLAVSLNKPRWFLVHHHVTFARQLLRPFLFKPNGKRRKRQRIKFRKTSVFDDLRIFEMYDDVVQSSIPVGERKGHWAQEFQNRSRALDCVRTQFEDTNYVRQIVQEMKSL